MGRINVCEACNAIKHGIRTRVAWEHTCGEKNVSYALKNIPGYASFPNEPDQQTIDAVNAMAELAFKKIKK